MSNSPLVNYTKISPNSSSRTSAIKKITIHHMAGILSVEACGDIFASASRKASSNYGIDSGGRVGMYVEEKRRAWTSSSTDNDNQAVTIEVSNDETGGNWHVSDKALEKTIELCADICRRNGIERINFTGNTSGNLTMHKWFAATECPGPYLESKFPYIAGEVNKRISEIPEDANGCPYGSSTETVRLGSSGLTVKRCQWYLTELGYGIGEIDGDCGSKTVAGITAFQMDVGLEADGICGSNTWARLEKTLSEKIEREENEEMAQETIYENYEDIPDWGKPTVKKLLDKSLLTGDGSGLNISYSMLRVLVINDRAGLYDLQA